MSEPKRILLGVSGGIAAYKAAELVRLLRKDGAEVRVAMTRAAAQFVTPLTFQALSGNPVHTDLLDAESENAMDHISLARWADRMVIAPATANLIAKLSHGLADDLLTTLYLAATCPVYVAPAMNQAMWGKPVTQENVAALQRHGVRLIGPAQGEQACGETGFGRMSEPQAICNALLGDPAERSLQGMKVLISAGPTREPLDPVRYITNRSSGKMGYALAEAAREMGASVILVSGPTQLPPPAQVDLVRVETAAEMYAAVIARAEAVDIYIGAAAVADYTPVEAQPEKIKKQGDTTTLVLSKTRDILAEVAALEKRPFTVGFAAETADLEAYALDKLARKNLDMIAANWVGQAEGGFDSDRNALEVFWKGGRKTLAMTDKKCLADRLTALIAERLQAGVVAH
ncbi:bifunctional phosphopantothenoylcysteine decarboxylase/phosphopantothenate--cysteine ligase CoaBC [Candidatus Methylomicrobium oryzae]|uniref:bifunctional phosphopantothenoylcysteine decarboxylase/phosphopantothenate--cysteine ligase CoaBC n=1 Tax=Candidatus Methylomicrobium oryzae TaxID=2802053 RepID=UPI0019213598|nr:bifunctional phosphopantothenoylcysteine decarboxylase/phosphopantothenate--cysteine ligase CoaBC [Methylomicrobium sp. RS1]MBL1264688.1 bifunctional phosphopantothenoylcysteine decarboxylase/phosphopantothenate--cysteine ligase CoaBC [Methylomicrobium sp. RS1]